jgi:hypothetical protein
MEPLSYTHQRLAEAKFFYSNFVDLLPLQPPLTPESGYYLNAFLASARSVCWVMRCEYSKITDWETWYENGKTTEEEKRVLKRISDLRNQSQKQKPIEPELVPMLVADLVPLTSLPQNQLGDALLPDDPENWCTFSYNPSAGAIWVTVVENQEIRTSCERYLEFLERIVAECEEKFGVPQRLS